MDNKIINCDILKETYNADGNNIECVLHCKVNLKEFENQHFNFNEHFIRKTISRWLPTVKTIYNYALPNPVIAKFYIIPSSVGNTAKVLEYNKTYYKKLRNIPESELLEVGSIISLKDIPGVYIKCGEISTIEYNEVFKVTGVAKCHPEDEFNEVNGRHIALHKAMTALNKRNIAINIAIAKLVMPVVDMVESRIQLLSFNTKQLEDTKPNL